MLGVNVEAHNECKVSSSLQYFLQKVQQMIHPEDTWGECLVEQRSKESSVLEYAGKCLED